MAMNLQLPVKQDLRVSGDLVVHSVFDTIQGEGPFAGRPAVFVRLADCNLQCPGCDTEYTKGKRTYNVADLIDLVERTNKGPAAGKLVVITGGEPLRQNIVPFVRVLKSAGYDIQIETNGTLFVPDMPWHHVTVVCSPKTGKLNRHLMPHISALKYVLDVDSYSEEDGLPIKALDHSVGGRVARPWPDFKGTVYLQPMDCKNDVRNNINLKKCVEMCMKHGYTLQIQLHKLLGVE